MKDYRTLPLPPVLLISDSSQAKVPIQSIFTAASDAGLRWFMVREKSFDTKKLIFLTKQLIAAVDPSAIVIVNGDVQAAIKSGAGGVQLQKTADVAKARKVMGRKCLIGYSAHSIEDAAAGAIAGADYVTLSPIFKTESKPGYGPALGVSSIANALKASRVPIIALAGISAKNAGEVLHAGASGFAVMGEVMRASDPIRTVTELINVFELENDSQVL